MLHRMTLVSVCALGAVAAWNAQALAAPANGFGVFVGLARHQSQGEFNEAPLDGFEWSVDSQGLSAGVDYQFAVSDVLSIHPFLMTSSEATESDELTVDHVAHGIYGVELRVWMNDLFVGGHVGNYSEVLTSDDEQSGGSGFGYGLTVGWESDLSGLFTMVQADRARVEYKDAESELTGFRAHLGWRFK